MFNSASSCTANSQVTVSFVSSKNQVLDISLDVTIAVDGMIIPTRPINILTGQRVTAIVTSPLGFLQHEFFEYTLDNQKSYFAVVNKNDYRPTVKSADAPKKWFNYNTRDIKVSFYNGYNSFQHPLGFGRNLVDIATSHIVLDHIQNAVSFYGTNQIMITRVVLPAGPVEYKKYSYVIPQTGITTTEALILCTNNRLYRIRFDNQYFDSDTFTPTVIPVISLGNLWFEQDLPTGETFIESNQKRLLSKLSPALTALDIGPNNIWLAGYDSVFILNNNFQLVKQIKYTRQTIIAISAINNDAIVTTRTGQIIYINAAGDSTVLYSSSALGTPTSINNQQSVAVPDPNNRRLLIFSDSSGDYSTWETEDFAPAYAREFDGKLWVTGHDTNVVLKFDSPTAISKFEFDYKVTIVSVVDGSILGVNYLQNFVTLDLTGIEKVIPVKFESHRGPRSHVGTDPIQIVCLGQEAVIPKTSPGLTCWTNGLKNEMIKTGDYVGISYRGESIGKFRSVLVLGDSAFDYDVEVLSATKPTDYYYSNLTAYHRLPVSGNIAVALTPEGNINTGINESINLPFTFNMYGNLYSNISVTTNGYITFDGNVVNQPAGAIGSLGIDALHVEPLDLYQGLAIDNSDPLSITYSALASGETPGVYYQSGTLGQFLSLRIRWIGTSMSTRPMGTTVIVGNNIQNSDKIPVNSISNIFVDDYISGNGITTSTRVVSTSTYGPIYVDAYAVNNSNNYFVVSRTPLLNSIPKNSWATTNGVDVAYIVDTDESLIRRGGAGVDIVLDFVSNILTINGLISTSVNYEYTVLVTLTNYSVHRKYDVLNITSVTDILTCINVVDPKTIEVAQFDYEKVYVKQNISNSELSISAKLITNGQNLIEFSSNHNLNVGDTVSFDKTVIEFISALPANIILYEKVGFELNRIFVTDATQLSINLGTNVTIQGNFITSNATVSLLANVSLLCAPYRAATPAYTYEVGFYSDGNRQYLEYFYDSNNHLFSTPVGIETQNANFPPVITSVVSGNSTVFFSEAAIGIWTNLGLGSFDANTRGFIPRNFTPEFVPSPETNTTTVQFIIDQDIKLSSEVLVSTTYGYLTVNNYSYYGQNFITKDSLITLRVPFNDSLRAVAPIISIDSHQIAIPMKSSIASLADAELLLPTNTTNYLLSATNILVEDSITIPVSDSYFLPDYYRGSSVSSENDINYFLVSNETTTRLEKGQSYEFMSGDVVQIKNVLTSLSIYDDRNAFLVGPVVLKSNWRTGGPDLIDTIVFDTLVSPYQSNSEYIIEDGIIYDVGYRLYQSNTALITANSNFNCNLFVDTYGSSIIVDNQPVVDYWAVNVPVGANITITRDVFNILQQPIKLYQVLYDTRISSNVFVEIGEWDIQNQVTTGSELLEVSTFNSKIEGEFIPNSPDIIDNLTSIVDRSSQILNSINDEILDNNYTTHLGKIDVKDLVDSSSQSIFKIGLSNDLKELNSNSTYIDSFKISVNSIPDSFKSTVFVTKIRENNRVDTEKTIFNGKIVNDNLVSGYKSSSFTDSVDLNSLPLNYKSSVIGGRIDQNPLPSNYKSSSYIGKIENSKISLNYKSSTATSRVDNDLLPANYKLSYLWSKIDNSTIPLNYRSSNYTSRINNSTMPLNYRSSNYISRIENSTIPLNYSSSNYISRVDNSTMPLNYRSSNYLSQIDNSTMPLTFRSSNYRSRIDNSSMPLNYRSSNYLAQIENNSIPLTFKSSNYRSKISNSNVPLNYRSSNYLAQIRNNSTPLTFKSSVNTSTILSDLNVGNWKLSVLTKTNDVELNLSTKKSLFYGKRIAETTPISTSFFKYKHPANSKTLNESISYLIGLSAVDSKYQTFSSLLADIQNDNKPLTENLSLLKGKNLERLESSVELINYKFDPVNIPANTTIFVDSSDFRITGYTIVQAKNIGVEDQEITILAVPNNYPITQRNSEILVEREFEEIKINFSSTYFEFEIPTIVTELANKKDPVVNQATELRKLLEPTSDYATNIFEKFDIIGPETSTVINYDLAPQADQFMLMHLPLVGILDNLTYIKKPLTTLLDVVPPILLPLIPVWDRETLLSKQLTRIPDEPTQIYKPLTMKLDSDPIWVPEQINISGAYKTIINIYADNGRGGDSITDKGNPPSRLPFVLYNQEYNYMYGGYSIIEEAKLMSEKFNAATAIPIVATDYWNYRIYFNKKHYCVPKKGRIFPVKWYIRGG